MLNIYIPNVSRYYYTYKFKMYCEKSIDIHFKKFHTSTNKNGNISIFLFFSKRPRFHVETSIETIGPILNPLSTSIKRVSTAVLFYYSFTILKFCTFIPSSL